ncbi:MAG TPA: hypothetical protein VFX70_13565 [Mycobacteriales bacterium]|nr:hypothetical protein [Mycobacteriales bacterium]
MAGQAVTVPGWAGRSYAHLAMPVPVLGDTELTGLDRAVCARDGWRPVEERVSHPVLVRRWQRPAGGLLVLVTLGWYPLLVTVGSTGAGRGGRRALARVTDAARAAGGLPVGDADLAGWVRATRERWARVVAARRRLDEHLPLTEFRACPRCPAWSAREVPHCRGCGHRFTSREDLERDARGRAARDVVAAATAELAGLGRGDGLFPPATGRPAGKVVA